MLGKGRFLSTGNYTNLISGDGLLRHASKQTHNLKYMVEQYSSTGQPLHLRASALAIITNI